MSARSRTRRRRNRARNGAATNARGRQQQGAQFWGAPAKLPTPEHDIRMTSDPSAVPRSLGPPPLPGHEAVAEHYFAAVYDRAVTTAAALAAAGGLIDPEALADEMSQ